MSGLNVKMKIQMTWPNVPIVLNLNQNPTSVPVGSWDHIFAYILKVLETYSTGYNYTLILADPSSIFVL